MTISVQEATRQLEQRGLLKRRTGPDQSDRIIAHVSALLGQELPTDLKDLYRERIESVNGYKIEAPVWNDWPGVGWHRSDWWVRLLLHVKAAVVANDGCGNYYGLDLSADGLPAVYLFDHELDYQVEHCAGSSLGAFLLILADKDRAYQEKWPTGWELKIDPDIDKCPRAPPWWVE